MPRLRHAATEVVVNVDDDTAARLGPDWQPTEQQPQAAEKPQPRRGRAKKPDSSNE